MPNPSNEFSLAAKKAGLSYWEYMEKIHPSIVQKFVWGPAKVEEVKRPRSNKAIAFLTHLNYMQNLTNGRY